MSGSERAAELAARFEQTHGEALGFAESCSGDGWDAVTSGERWPVGVVVGHIAQGYAAVERWVCGYLEGRPVSETRDTIHAGNAEHLAETSERSRDETIGLLRVNAASVAATIRGLSDEQLAITFPMAVADGAPMSAEQLVQILFRHTANHLESCRQAVAG